MPGLKTLQELISLLYSERKILAWFFEQGVELSEDSQELWALINQDKSRLKRLIEANILLRDKQRIRLNQDFGNGIRQMLRQVDAPDSEKVNSLRNRLKRQIAYYQLANNDQKFEYLFQIKASLWELKDRVQQTIIAIESWLILSLREKKQADLFEAKSKMVRIFIGIKSRYERRPKVDAE